MEPILKFYDILSEQPLLAKEPAEKYMKQNPASPKQLVGLIHVLLSALETIEEDVKNRLAPTSQDTRLRESLAKKRYEQCLQLCKSFELDFKKNPKPLLLDFKAQLQQFSITLHTQRYRTYIVVAGRKMLDLLIEEIEQLLPIDNKKEEFIHSQLRQEKKERQDCLYEEEKKRMSQIVRSLLLLLPPHQKAPEAL